MSRDNRGVTFIELIIVVAIMSLLVGITGYGIGMISGKSADECAQKLVSSLEQTRTKAVGKYSVKYELSKDSSTGMVEVKETVIAKEGDTPIVTESIIGAKDVTIVCYFEGGSTRTITSSNYLLINFDRATGGFKPEISGDPDCTKIEVSKASTTKKIILVPPTGKVYFE